MTYYSSTLAPLSSKLTQSAAEVDDINPPPLLRQSFVSVMVCVNCSMLVVSSSYYDNGVKTQGSNNRIIPSTFKRATS